MKNKSSPLALFSLMLVLFLDGMGQGIVFPIFSKAIFNSHSLLLSATTSEAARNIWYGILVGAFFFCWFIGAAVLSEYSDKSGRKNALIICLGGSALGNLLSALAFSLNDIWLLLFSRILVGFTNGSQPIAQASIVDTTPKDKLSRRLGYVVAAVCIGLVAGPLVGGFLSTSAYVSWFRDSTPLYFAAILAALNMVLLIFFYHETFSTQEKVKLSLVKAFKIIGSAFTHKSVRYLSVCYLCFQIGWLIYYVYISAYVAQKYAFSITEVSLFFALLGVGMTLGLAFISAFFEKIKLKPKRVVLLGYTGGVISVVATVFPNTQIWAWAWVIPIGAFVGFGYAFILTLFSGQVSKEKQGWVMGITSSFLAVSAGISSLVEGLLSPLDLKLPLYVSIGMLLLGLLFFTGFRPRSH